MLKVPEGIEVPGMGVIRAVVEDLDDTKVCSRGTRENPGPKIAHHIEVARRLGHTLTLETIDEFWGQGLEVELPNFYGHPEGRTFEDLLAEYNDLVKEFPKTPLPGARRFHDALNRLGLIRGVVTSLHTDNARTDLETAGFDPDDYFFIHGADITPELKPDPRAFEPCLELLREQGVFAGEVLYIGDTLGDGIATIDAGMQFIGVASGRVAVRRFWDTGLLAAVDLETVGHYLFQNEPAVAGLAASA